MAEYYAPTDLDEALDLMARRPLRVIAGGTDVYPAQGDRPFTEPLLDITRIASLDAIEPMDDGWRIGAMTRWSTIAEAALPAAFHGLQQAAHQVGGVQIQNAGTIGGNLCNASPAADGVPPLLTLDARVELAGPQGRRHLPLDEFLTGARQTALGPGELLVAVTIADPGEAAVSSFIKLGSRSHLVISIAMVAALLVADGHGRVGAARIAVGACSPVAQRLDTLESALVGQAWDGPTLIGQVETQHLAALNPIDDVRGSADYRRRAALELTRRALAGCLMEAS